MTPNSAVHRPLKLNTEKVHAAASTKRRAGSLTIKAVVVDAYGTLSDIQSVAGITDGPFRVMAKSSPRSGD